MKRILLSVSVLVVAIALVAGGTIAFYSDTETSTGNVFTAGALDLLVDHTYASYNGEECLGACDVNVYSNTEDVVDGGDDAVATWVHPVWTDIDDAIWIWDTYFVADPANDEQFVFTKTFEIDGLVSAGDFEIAADNGYKLVINGTTVIDDLANEYNYSSVDDYNVTALLVAGDNDIEITVKNFAGSSNPKHNPAGVIYRLQVQSNCGGGYTETPGASCELWMEQNLDTETFFNFGDVKPGDWGVNVISLHVFDNDAHACLIIHDEENLENDLVDPEAEAGDTSTPEGELSSQMDLFAWEDLNADGSYDPPTEPTLYEGDFDIEIVQLELTGNGPVEFVGLAWCAGTMDVDHDDGDIDCDGAGMSNTAQTDSLTASLTAYVEQTRNNDGFLCSEVDLDENDG